MRVTFDTNTLDKAVRPERFPKDPCRPDYIKVHQAVVAGQIEGFLSETIMTLEGIQRVDRAPVFNSTRLRQEPERVSVDDEGTTTSGLTLVLEQLRKPLHLENAARIRAAVDLGFRLLRAPRIGLFHIDDPDGKYVLQDDSHAALAKRIAKYLEVLHAIDQRGVGSSHLQSLGAKFALRDNVQEHWFHSLIRAKDIHEQREVERAIAEWSDADSIATHIGYGLDLFCTGDAAKSAGAPSILDSTNRAWLQATYGITFVTISELATRI